MFYSSSHAKTPYITMETALLYPLAPPPEDSWDNPMVTTLSGPSTAHPPASPVHRPTPPRMPSHCSGHMPSHVTVTTTAIPMTATATATAASKEPRTNPFSLWDGNNTPLEVPEAQEGLMGPCRGVWAVSAIAAWSGKGKLTVMGSKGPNFFYCTLSHYHILVLLLNTNNMIYMLCIK